MILVTLFPDYAHHSISNMPNRKMNTAFIHTFMHFRVVVSTSYSVLPRILQSSVFFKAVILSNNDMTDIILLTDPIYTL